MVTQPARRVISLSKGTAFAWQHDSSVCERIISPFQRTAGVPCLLSLQLLYQSLIDICKDCCCRQDGTAIRVFNLLSERSAQLWWGKGGSFLIGSSSRSSGRENDIRRNVEGKQRVSFSPKIGRESLTTSQQGGIRTQVFLRKLKGNPSLHHNKKAYVQQAPGSYGK